MGWKLIFDNDAMNIQEGNGRVGKESVKEYKGGLGLIRVGDDDGNLYYMALCDDDESMENFHDWAMYDSGATWSEYWCTKENTWKGFIS